jgi:tRNA U34 2-thiouridine synthase MnmA/TrmU
VRFKSPVAAVVAGQYAVFYQGDRVLGGGMIEGCEPNFPQAVMHAQP